MAVGQTNTHNYPDHFPRRANMRVNQMAYSADIDRNGKCRMELGKPVALDADGIVAAQSVATALVKSSAGIISGHRTSMGKYGRNVTIVLSGAGTPAIEIFGWDYLGQPMSETMAGNGTTPVLGVKAFKEVEYISVAALAGETINVGWGNALGLPYAMGAITEEYVDGVAPTAGTKTVASSTTQTASTADPRGTYLPHSSFLPNASRDYVLIGKAFEGDYHGLAHFRTA